MPYPQLAVIPGDKTLTIDSAVPLFEFSTPQHYQITIDLDPIVSGVSVEFILYTKSIVDNEWRQEEPAVTKTGPFTKQNYTIPFIAAIQGIKVTAKQSGGSDPIKLNWYVITV